MVILCEPQVKPTLEHQAVARAHRMGQVRTVQVHRLLAEDSVDQRLWSCWPGRTGCSTRTRGAAISRRPRRTRSTSRTRRWRGASSRRSSSEWRGRRRALTPRPARTLRPVRTPRPIRPPRRGATPTGRDSDRRWPAAFVSGARRPSGRIGVSAGARRLRRPSRPPRSPSSSPPPRPCCGAARTRDRAVRLLDQQQARHAHVRVALDVAVVHPRARPHAFARNDLEAEGVRGTADLVVDHPAGVVGPVRRPVRLSAQR